MIIPFLKRQWKDVLNINFIYDNPWWNNNLGFILFWKFCTFVMPLVMAKWEWCKLHWKYNCIEHANIAHGSVLIMLITIINIVFDALNTIHQWPLLFFASCVTQDSKLSKTKLKTILHYNFIHVTHVILEMYMWSNEVEINVNTKDI
jgi:hypothetical protein